MPLREQWDALYRLFYKRDVRSAFASGQLPPGLNKHEADQFRAVDPARLNMVVQLHTPDIAGWYRHVPATWLALQAVLDANEYELVGLLTASDAFELRVNDDEGCRALAGFIAALPTRDTRDAGWLGDLLHYELLIAGRWPDERSPRVEKFRFDVEGIRRALVEQRLCPTGETPGQHAILFHRGKSEIGEAALNPDQASWLADHLGNKDAPAQDRKSGVAKRCLTLLKAVGVSLLLAIAVVACDARAGENNPEVKGLFADLVPDTNNSLPKIKLTPAFPKLKFKRPLWLTNAGDNRLFVVEQYDQIHVFENKHDVAEAKVFLDLSKKIITDSNEEGVLCLAFHPKFAANNYCYVSYNAPSPQRSVISRFTISKTDKDKADPATEKVILEIPQRYFNHKGCTLLFGKDGFLYASFGDGGSQHDPHKNGQNLGVMLAKVLRIDVDKEEGGKNYAVPRDNPFVDRAGALPEIWAYGLRNTWRMSFDSETGDLWGGDAGQNSWEEVNLIQKGGNYGWSIREGSHRHEDGPAPADPYIEPVAEYSNRLGRAIIGGYVYRGAKFKDMQGVYFYGDYSSGCIWGLRAKDGKATENGQVLKTTRVGIASFGVDKDNELYVCGFGLRRTEEGEILRVEPE
ncbi:MAG: PQQ-dependent sugar dehydrogenase [Planctomycetes bacterium]|nr:PQQ-dependent sugar dehydrogenase [Planctomycetota bacterium]